ncbi:hypothetical protein HZP46_02025 [Elizabethkingia anophelis]|nr:hypothetical protein [Elizabethkingia anophelis]
MNTNLNNPDHQDKNHNDEHTYQNPNINPDPDLTLNIASGSKTEKESMQNEEPNASEMITSPRVAVSNNNPDYKKNRDQKYEHLEEIPVEELDEIGILKRIILSADKNSDLLDLALPRLSEFNHNCTYLPGQVHEIGLYSKTIFMMLEEEKKNREEFLNNLPKEIPAVIFPKHLESLKSIKKTATITRQLQYGLIGVIVVAILFISISGHVGITNYKIGVKTKEEHRGEFLQELKDEGCIIVQENEFNELKSNTKVLQQWIKRYPRESDSFTKFREGFRLHSVQKNIEIK